ncbi:MAG: tRNA (guanosine(37)-N1)-methyltransferase TrmD, partial [Chloroflexi bacterium]|nr:tRNA (guanosine(37)-N1)-methyltransferase TrmD [Chloroflexota bacterium]
MRIDVLTIFPKMFRSPFDESIVKRAVDNGLVSIHLHDIRHWAKDRHKTVDDSPYGGGPGMVMKPDVVFAAAEAVLDLAPQREPVILLTPAGRRLTHEVVLELAARERLVLLCGHYEGFDARVHEQLATDEISIGDFVLSGGELAAMVLVDAVVRHIPGALGSPQSTVEESFAQG